ncbi:MAG TPA: MarR family transcriptional regulator [Candidatus Saccharimonadales bacterium]|nr:MarR family transcriptional regulator [Candidatus Saccharimonadales bacterium]
METRSLQAFYDGLMQFLAMSKQQMFKIAADYGLTSTQAFLLLLTKSDETRTMHSFCSLLGCDASNVTGIVDGLERKGLISRTEHPTDRRIKTLRLLPKGTTVRNAILQQMSDRNQSYILSKLSASELATFTALIQKITSGCAANAAETAGAEAGKPAAH